MRNHVFPNIRNFHSYCMLKIQTIFTLYFQKFNVVWIKTKTHHKLKTVSSTLSDGKEIWNCAFHFFLSNITFALRGNAFRWRRLESTDSYYRNHFYLIFFFFLSLILLACAIGQHTLERGTADADLKFASAENPERSEVLSFKSGAFRSTSPSPTARATSFIISPFEVHSTSFFHSYKKASLYNDQC